ncbi:phage baseplate assembly protein V [Paraburkholderia phenoliruptrix]|uniref:phage baseplate assembly protein V n=1 Tax=Paraburkholderia phenoliruptrix TaxID=252970 RepID=UPI0028612B90|nr:phage baseplate assembly protein V [Paraburkholderia phenoliruptrix]MDR6387574.1 phage baseplate assembly protein V [Paraburkholderia phenoliruptrix]
MNANESSRQFLNGIRKGTVESVEGALCRVVSGDLHTDWIQWFSPFAGESIEWHAPSIGEGVMLLCPTGDPAQAVALRGFFSEDFPPPSTDPAKHMRVYRDGASIEYDMAAHVLNAVFPDGGTVNITAPGAVNVTTKTATVKADDLTLDATQTTVTGAMLVKGSFAFENGMTGKAGTSGGPTMAISGTVAVSDDVIAGGKSSAHHKHLEQGDGQLVGEPQ